MLSDMPRKKYETGTDIGSAEPIRACRDERASRLKR